MNNDWDNIPVSVILTDDGNQYVKLDDVIRFLKLVHKDAEPSEKKIVHLILTSFIKCKNSPP